ncbi:MAG: Gfo/Idh/MocA family oxidoreductase [Clostridiales bacterium]|nr:Gfo/Idh/MocA family oxidoreductase [Clostridiales bacterium]
MLKVAMLSKWHVHAAGYAGQLKNSGKVEITAVWDDDEARGKPWADELGAVYYKDLNKLLAEADCDAVVCDAPTTAHKDVIIAAAKAGKHIFTEKALAPTLDECEEIKAAIEKAGVTFVISYPMRGLPVIQLAKKFIAEGVFGTVSMVRIRNGHSGVSNNWLPAYWYEEKDTGGGAMMDLGCHPMYTLAYLCGKPKRVTGLFTAPLGSKIDENAVSTIEFENGAIGVAETSFDSYNTRESIEIYGTDATLLSVGGDVKFVSRETEKYVRGFITPTLPNPKPSPLIQFVDACIAGTGSPEGLGIDDALALTELLENSYISDKKNKIVVL